MIEGWRFQPLGAVTENFDKVRIPIRESDRRHGPYPYYGASGIVDHIDDYLFDGEYLLIAEDGENLRTRKTPVAFIANGRFWVNNHAHVVRGDDGSETRFLMYALSVTDISGYLTGSTLPELTQGNLNRIMISLPPLPEQRAIASILGALEAKIELNRRMGETLEAMAQAVFKSWFVDLEPFGGSTPATWDTVALDEAVEVLAGGTPKTSVSEYWKGAIPWFSVKDAPALGEIWVLETERAITQEGVDNSAAQVLPVGTTIMSARGTVGKLALVGVPMAMNQSCFELKSRLDEADMFTYFTARTLVAELQRRAHGSVFDTINRETLSSLTVHQPPAEVIANFEATVGSMLDRVKLSLLESVTLAALRDTLLPKLISGELRVSDAERIAG